MTDLNRVAAIQMVSGGDLAANLDAARQMTARAAQRGARLVVLPENFAFLGARDTDKLAIAETEGDGPIQQALADMAREHGVWLVGGTAPIRGTDGRRVRAACLVYDDAGVCRARYDKLHLFDVRIDERETYAESRTLEPGDGGPVVVDTPVGRMGLAVCYDLRFPELFRELVNRGAELVAVPSAFTAVTGAAHWEILVRARAVENLCFIVAPDQGGEHPTGRKTFGESMIVDPWGRILARRGTGPGVVLAAIDLDELSAVRRRFPALDHRRLRGAVTTDQQEE